MAILSSFRSFERYLKVPTEDGNKYQLVSERTLAKDVIFDDNSNLNDKIIDVNKSLNDLDTNIDNVTNSLGTQVTYSVSGSTLTITTK